ncbi:MAG: SOS response-associated peptidase [Pseudolabrys sp.]|nr:SOS response-associated peptidase [Pseudolabrys sp.]
MCGRFTLTVSPQQLRGVFGYPEQPNFPARYNIAPTQPIAVVRLMNGRRQFALMRWGLLPSWVKDPKQVSLLFNARGESINDKPSFRAAMRYRRCLIPADGFYEWQTNGRTKQPYFIRRKDGAAFAFAGLWETWNGPNGEELDTATIVTIRADETLKPIHERMPVIVPETSFDTWLDFGAVDSEAATALIASAPDDLLEAYPVSGAVGNVANDNPTLTQPGEVAADAPPPKPRKKREPPDDGQPTLF